MLSFVRILQVGGLRSGADGLWLEEAVDLLLEAWVALLQPSQVARSGWSGRAAESRACSPVAPSTVHAATLVFNVRSPQLDSDGCPWAY